MANKLYEETNIQAIADAIRSKNGSSDTYTVAQMAQAITDIPSNVEIENGKIVQLSVGKKYVSDTGIIKKNNFIEYMDFVEQSNSTNPGDNYYVSLSNNSYLCVRYSSRYTPSLIYDIHAVILTMDDNFNISYTNTFSLIQFESNQYLKISLSKISSSEIMMFYSLQSDKKIYGTKINISNNTVSAESPVELLDGSSLYYFANSFLYSELIDANKWLLTYNYSTQSSASYYRTYGVVVEYNNGTFSVGIQTELTSNSYSGDPDGAKLCLLNTNKCVISYRGGSYEYVGVVSISGTTITVGTGVQVGYSSNYNKMTICSVDTDVFGCFYRSSSAVYSHCATVNGNTITIGSSVNLTYSTFWDSSESSRMSFNAIKVGESNIFVCGLTVGKELCGVLCQYSNGKFTALTNTNKKMNTTFTSMTSGYLKVFTINNNTILLSAGNISGLSGTRICKVIVNNNDFYSYAKAMLSISKINGVTIEEISPTEPGDVYILDV